MTSIWSICDHDDGIEMTDHSQLDCTARSGSLPTGQEPLRPTEPTCHPVIFLASLWLLGHRSSWLAAPLAASHLVEAQLDSGIIVVSARRLKANTKSSFLAKPS